MKDKLFVLRPGFEDHGGTYFCPFAAQVMGFLAYYPKIRDTLEIIELEFPRPRQPLVDLVGEAHQATPLLVLAGEPAHVPHVVIEEAGGHRFVKNTISILRYLAATRGVPGPH